MKSRFIDTRVVLIMVIIFSSCAVAPPPTMLEEPPDEGRRCTMIGCEDQATVTILTADVRLPTFAIEATANGETVVCNSSQSTKVFSSIMKCSSDNITAEQQHRPNCKRFELINGDSIQCLGGGSRVEILVTYRGTPEQMTIKLRKHGKIIEERTFSFGEYKVSQPNGPGCNPICRYASGVWVLD